MAGHAVSLFGNSELMAKLYQWLMSKSVHYDVDAKVWKKSLKK